jgi:hypothetical protein
MRASDLLQDEVVARDGTKLGRVRDLELVQDGPPTGAFGASLRLESIVFGPSSVGVRLGFSHGNVEGPWALKALFARQHRHLRTARWDDVERVDDGRIRVRVDLEELEHASERGGRAGRMVHAGLQLLDHQLVDPDGRLAGNVDDLLFSDDDPPIVTSILCGPSAFGPRIGGRLGGWIVAVHRRLQLPGQEGPGEISFGVVGEIGPAVKVTVRRDELPSSSLEHWTRDHLISHIPGNDR